MSLIVGHGECLSERKGEFGEWIFFSLYLVQARVILDNFTEGGTDRIRNLNTFMSLYSDIFFLSTFDCREKSRAPVNFLHSVQRPVSTVPNAEGGVLCF